MVLSFSFLVLCTRVPSENFDSSGYYDTETEGSLVCACVCMCVCVRVCVRVCVCVCVCLKFWNYIVCQSSLVIKT
jgi:hypothetical protein